MSKHPKKDFSSKHPPDRKVDPRVAEEVERRAESGRISCAAAFEAARSLGVSPEEVGFTADRLELHITHCQLGLHGYGSPGKRIQPAEEVSDDLETAIRSRLEKGRLPCRSAWDLAKEFKTGRMKIASACDAIGVKISECQLGAF
ncbi:MAG: hypothetical protein ACQET7_13165 [Thermodesulfobacteriota bacterium]